MLRTFAGLTLVAVLAANLPGQSVNKPPAFVIADVHPVAQPARTMKGPFIAGDRFELRGATVLDMIRLAYSPANAFMADIDDVVGGPSWLNFDRYDVAARVPPHSSYESTKMMLRALLADRFKAVIRNDSAPRPAYVLTAGDKPALKQADGSKETGCKMEGAAAAVLTPGAMMPYSCRNMTMAAFADALPSIGGADLHFNSRVIDESGLKGAWDFDFKVSSLIRPAGTPVVTLIDALQKQLGLDLRLKDVSSPVLLVGGANEKPTPNLPDVAKALPPLPQEFEVADIKRTPPAYNGFRFQLQPGGRVEIHGATLRTLLIRAWGLGSDSPNQAVIGPKFIDAERFDIVAKAPTFGLPPDAPAAAASDPRLAIQLRFTDDDSVASMLRTLLVQRFGLTFHNEQRPLPAFRLTAVKPKLRKADPSHRTGCHQGAGDAGNPWTLVCENLTMAQFATALPSYDLANVLSRREGPIANVLDATGLQGAWDFTVRFNPFSSGGAGAASNPFTGGNAGDAPAATGGQQAADPSGSNFFEAMEKELGLKLEKTQRPGPVMVIDHVDEQPKEN